MSRIEHTLGLLYHFLPYPVIFLYAGPNKIATGRDELKSILMLLFLKRCETLFRLRDVLLS